jgi:magnesium chelatase subunit D
MEVTPVDVRRVAAMALRHRLRRDPLEQTTGGSQIEQAADELFGASEEARAEQDSAASDARQRRPKKTPPDETGGNDNGGGQARSASPRENAGREASPPHEGRPAPPLDARLPFDSVADGWRSKLARPNAKTRAKRQAQTRPTSSRARGRYSRAVAVPGEDLKIALDATMRAAASAQFFRHREASGHALQVESGDFRYKHFSRRTGTLFIFAVDTSGSMALNRISQAKGALARLLRQSYVNRDRVALITFREREGRVLLAPSQSSALAKRLLDALPVGGATPLTAGLLRALEMCERGARQGTERIVLLVFTDGRANVPRAGQTNGDRAAVRRQIKSEVEQIGVALQRLAVASVVVDTQNRFTSGGEGEALAQALGGRHVHLLSRP